ncbi:hypothetical protein [Pseudomonas plecoglossicida]|uniref:hypothetical protein n=1 Tax=Pseudomonas plecoglossicida TaxID=70775 RepID=UPI0020D10DFA|nr:hypothetical protein [Pseudomonas plecoglossicida]
MPTENRSSNTDPRDVFIRLNPLGLGEAELRKDSTGFEDQRTHSDYLLFLAGYRETHAEPQANPEPIAWMVDTAFWWIKEEAERDAAATGLPIVGLGPMAGSAPAQEHQGEPVAADGATFMGEPNFQHSIEWYREGISKHWKKICDLRAEVERLRAALKFYADREHYHFESGNWDTVSGEPLNILWCGEEPDFIEDGTVARAALERQS